MKLIKYYLFFFVVILLSGCAFKYCSNDVTHIWGIGHFKYKYITDNNTNAIAVQEIISGFKLNLGKEIYSIGLGYDKYTKVLIVEPHKIIFLIWEDTLFNLQ